MNINKNQGKNNIPDSNLNYKNQSTNSAGNVQSSNLNYKNMNSGSQSQAMNSSGQVQSSNLNYKNQSTSSSSQGQDTMSAINQNQDMKQYFDSLPAFVQENILQSGVNVNSVNQLKQIAQNFTQGNAQG